MTTEANSVLFTTDLSDVSWEAFPYAVDAAQTFGTELYVLHVVQPGVHLHAPASALEDGGPDEEKVRVLLLEHVRAEIDKHLSDVKDEVLFHVHVVVGDPRTAIPQFVQDFDINLMVIASHGRNAIQRFLVGSVAETVASQAVCPTLLVNSKRHGDTEKSNLFQHVLAPVEFEGDNEISKRGLAAALEFAERNDARVTILHCVSPLFIPSATTYPGAYGVPIDMDWKKVIEEQVGNARSQILAMLAEMGAGMDKIEVRVMEAVAYDEIVKFSESAAVDLIVMPKQVRVGLDAILAGSVSKHVMRSAPCPVLLLNPKWLLEGNELPEGK